MTARGVTVRERLLAFATLVAGLAPLLWFGPWDLEETALGVFSSQVYYRALAAGHGGFWFHDLGFGTPMPIGQRLGLHPLFALGAMVSLRVALRLFWLTQAALLTWGVLELSARAGLRPRLRFVMVLCFGLSAASVCYFYANDWPSVVVGWTTYPALIVALHAVAVGDWSGSRLWRAAAGLALLFGFWIVNGHPGYVAPGLLVLVVYVVALIPRASAWRCFLAAGTLCAGLVAEHVWTLMDELGRFPPGLPREAWPSNTLGAYGNLLLAPLAGPDVRLRAPFIGVVMAGAIVAAGWSAFRRSDREQRALVVACGAAALLGLIPREALEPFRVFSAGWLFRDPMIAFGLVAGGAALQRLADRPGVMAGVLVGALVGVQLTQQLVVVGPALTQFWTRRGRLEFFRHQGRDEGVAAMIARAAPGPHARLYLGPGIYDRMRGALSAEGVHSATDLSLAGIDVINGWFKDVSMDAIYPSRSLMHGFIGGQRDVLENGPLLNVLGINMVLVDAREPVALPALDPVGRFPVNDGAVGGAALTLLANHGAWPRVVLMDPALARTGVPVRPDCGHDRALCRDYAPLVRARIVDEVRWREADGRYQVAAGAAADHDRLIFISTVYRSEWRARSLSGPVQVEPIAGAFLGITLPAGVREVDVQYQPRVRMALAWLHGLLIVGLLGAIVALPRATGRRPVMA